MCFIVESELLSVSHTHTHFSNLFSFRLNFFFYSGHISHIAPFNCQQEDFMSDGASALFRDSVELPSHLHSCAPLL